jgi:hypothetical protein
VFILANSVWSRPDSKLPWAADQSLPEPALLTLVLEGTFGAIFSNHAEALLEAQDWHGTQCSGASASPSCSGSALVRIYGGARPRRGRRKT